MGGLTQTVHALGVLWLMIAMGAAGAAAYMLRTNLKEGLRGGIFWVLPALEVIMCLFTLTGAYFLISYRGV